MLTYDLILSQKRNWFSNNNALMFSLLQPFLSNDLKFLSILSFYRILTEITAHLLLSPNMQAFMFKMTEKHELIRQEMTQILR